MDAMHCSAEFMKHVLPRLDSPHAPGANWVPRVTTLSAL